MFNLLGFQNSITGFVQQLLSLIFGFINQIFSALSTALGGITLPQINIG